MTIWDVLAGKKSGLEAKGTHTRPDIMMSVEEAERSQREGRALMVNDGRYVMAVVEGKEP